MLHKKISKQSFPRRNRILLLIALLSITSSIYAQTGSIEGFVLDKKNNETLIGASITLDGNRTGTITNADGQYKISNISPGVHFVIFTYIGYNNLVVENITVEANKITQLNGLLDSKNVSLDEVVVSSKRRTNTEATMLTSIKTSPLVVSSISNQQILRSQDRDASEVIKRVPGITIIGDRFIVVRGLSQRYNTVWLNNASTPSSETDVKAFSFDIIPSGLIDNIMIFKTAAPEYPADFTGGFVKVTTKNIPEKKFLSIDYSTSYRSGTTFNNFYMNKGGKTDWLGFDDGTRALPNDFPSNLADVTDANQINKLSKEFNQNWTAQKHIAIPDQRLSFTLGRKFNMKDLVIGNTTSLGYSNSFSSYTIQNNSYTSFIILDDKPGVRFNYNDDQYTNTVRLNALSNFSLLINRNNSIEFRNLFNQNSFTRTILRSGYDGYRQDSIKSYEYRFMSRTTYSGQLGGKHSFNEGITNLDWNLGFSYANRNEPDRKVLLTTLNENTGQYQLAIGNFANPKQAGRLYLNNYERIYSSGLNVDHKIDIGHLPPTIKAGYYFEYKNRSFNARNIGYKLGINYYPTNEDLARPFDSIFVNSNFDYNNGITIGENTSKSDSYDASNKLLSGYIGLNIPITINLNFYGGIRVESNKMTLNSYEPGLETPVNVDNSRTNFFPSININYNLSQKSLVRLAYGKTINRPEFREIAPFNFYDFNDAAGYSGNPKLKDAIIHNFDLRFESYPSVSETFSFALFYKNFSNPIELVYVDAGSGLQYSFDNAKSAKSMGAEIEIRKSFENISFLKYFNGVVNASLIKSSVYNPKDESAIDKNRPMVGQSPYIVNAGFYYQNQNNGWMVSVLYNVIGKRILIVGQRQQNSNDNIPDIYEMPSNLIDITFSKKIGKFEIKGGVKDLLNDSNKMQQTYSLKSSSGNNYTRTYSTKSYKSGTSYSIGISYKF